MHYPGGAVYTKTWIVELMLDEIGYTVDRDLSTLKVLEPSCGCGAFIIPIVKRLCNSVFIHHRSIESLYDCILGIDIDEHSAKICRDNIEEVLVSEGFSQSDAKSLATSWIVSEDFLLNSYSDFDIVLGNPPYIRSEELSIESRHNYANKLETVTLGTDLFVGFIENGLRSLSSSGKLCFICADRWMQNKYGSHLRKFITERFSMELICRMHGVNAFESEVSAYPAIIMIGMKSDTKCRYAVCCDDFGPSDVADFKHALVCGHRSSNKFTVSEMSISGSNPWPLANAEKIGLIKVFTSLFPTIEDSGVKIGIGLATGRDKVFITTCKGLVESERMLPIIKKEDITNGLVPPSAIHWLINPWNNQGELIDLDQYPLTRNYFESHKDSLMKRHITKKNVSNWYRTIDKVNPLLQSTPKLILQDMSKHPDPYYDDGNYYPSHNMYWLSSDKWDLKVLGGILMSNQVESFIDAIGVKMRGNTLRCQAQYLRMLHLPYPEDLDGTDKSGFKLAFETRDRKLATACMKKLLDRRSITNERRYETGITEVV